MKFQKGKSGNPGGRPKEVGHVRELARRHTAASIAALVDALADDNRRTRVAAAEALLDRGWGKAPQAITGEEGGAVHVITEIRRSIVDPRHTDG